MKAITIWQPWASLLACGAKRFETRSWATSYRGPIAIHAAKKDVFDALSMIPVPTAVATLIGCHEIDRIREMSCAPQETGCWDCNHRGNWIDASAREVALGDWTPGRYAWELADVKLIPPVRVGGKQGLWEWRRP